MYHRIFNVCFAALLCTTFVSVASAQSISSNVVLTGLDTDNLFNSSQGDHEFFVSGAHSHR